MGKRGPYADKPWAEALKLAMHREDEADPERRKHLVVIAEACIAAAKSGDMQAIKEIGDRLDGKPHQSTSNTHDLGDNTLKAAREWLKANAQRPGQ